MLQFSRWRCWMSVRVITTNTKWRSHKLSSWVSLFNRSCLKLKIVCSYKKIPKASQCTISKQPAEHVIKTDSHLLALRLCCSYVLSEPLPLTIRCGGRSWSGPDKVFHVSRKLQRWTQTGTGLPVPHHRAQRGPVEHWQRHQQVGKAKENRNTHNNVGLLQYKR